MKNHFSSPMPEDGVLAERPQRAQKLPVSKKPQIFKKVFFGIHWNIRIFEYVLKISVQIFLVLEKHWEFLAYFRSMRETPNVFPKPEKFGRLFSNRIQKSLYSNGCQKKTFLDFCGFWLPRLSDF